MVLLECIRRYLWPILQPPGPSQIRPVKGNFWYVTVTLLFNPGQSREGFFMA